MTGCRGCRRRPVPAALALLLALAGCATDVAPSAGCLVVWAGQGGSRLGAYPLKGTDPVVTLHYLHSVTLSPIEERYRITGTMLTQTELRFSEHGPGLPTQADAGQSWSRDGDQFVLRLDRAFDGILARVDPAQAPRLVVEGATVDLAQWGPRSIHIAARPGRCPAP